jgi:two-component system, cell cycle sensor histidine kinase and response regulator CckA
MGHQNVEPWTKPDGETLNSHHIGRRLLRASPGAALSQSHGDNEVAHGTAKPEAEGLRLENSARMFRAVFEKANDGMLLLEGGTCIACNPGASAMFGQECARLAGKTLSDLSPASQAGGLTSKVKGLPLLRAAQQGKEMSFRWSFARANGATFEAQVSLSPLEVGERKLLLAVLREITGQEDAERYLKLSQQAESAGRLARGMAHDFNNLLTVILGHCGLLAAGRRDEGETARSVAAIQKAAERTAALTQRLLGSGRERAAEPQRLQLNRVVGALTDVLRRLLGEDVELEVKLDPRAGSVRAKASQLEQVLMNLAENARDAMPFGGKVYIETMMETAGGGASEARPSTGGRFVSLSVRDTGYGMDAETQARVFEPSFSTKPLGKGLGLPMVNAFVQEMGGTISVWSQPRAGTTIRILLPAEDGGVAAEETGAGEAAPGGTETVLVVEDEPEVRTLVRALLEGKGYRVLEAAGPAEAMAISGSYTDPIHMVLTDVVMPEMTGPELIVCLFRTRPDIKHLYMSGYSTETLVERAICGPLLRLLHKPFTPQSLLTAVRSTLGIDPAGAVQW